MDMVVTVLPVLLDANSDQWGPSIRISTSFVGRSILALKQWSLSFSTIWSAADADNPITRITRCSPQ